LALNRDEKTLSFKKAGFKELEAKTLDAKAEARHESPKKRRNVDIAPVEEDSFLELMTTMLSRSCGTP